MAKSARRGPKVKASATSSTNTSGTSTPNSQSGPIPPFTKAPESLKPFLEPFPQREVYLVHIDTAPVDIKKQAFIVPCVINAAIVAILAYRVYMVRNIYPAMLATVVGMNSSMSLDTSTMEWEEIAMVALRRIGTVLLDYFLVTVLFSWPIRFWFGPVRWRRTVGFRGHEIIVRRSQPDMTQGLKRDRWIREDEETRDKIVAAVTPERLMKTGYLLVDADWDLDYDAMIHAHEMVADPHKYEKIGLDDFRTAVIVNTDAHGWLIWHVGDENEAINATTPGPNPGPSTPEEPVRSAQRDQILAFKDKLTAMGKEDLFFRWVELIQYESTLPGGFTPERQRSAMLQVQKLFEENGVSFSQFWEDVGGLEEFTEQLD
ncbi:hypothetical protein BO70DRAFT_8910 [Aspergillus heteromorphus CBS 117.55]|uniref:Uncharacterized protein n=1 Tax=Aspergillus heteromorphus CBS 117.55 TaxID=1448321 RepID=A0A317X2L1_9EURO|nr:uncharacterized protein BO70DRAFT_8910 [Aspergillus heteromorphus CBS 117.55]PWY92391.1 hypothetical protein BO70DRAFT_8910 [Aspergillus heteromorphus CBS 117.55]